jgi:Ca-activated chloride channel family protein
MTRRHTVTVVVALSLLAACGHGTSSGEPASRAASSTERPPTSRQQPGQLPAQPSGPATGSDSRAAASAAGPGPTSPGHTGTGFTGPGAAGDTRTDADPVSTFALDVDTASYDYAARALADGRLPDPGSVRPEEFVNAFDQDYAEPDGDGIALHVDGARQPSVEGTDTRIVRVGLQTRRAEQEQRRDATLTFVVDVSGSMSEPGRLDLVQHALHTLVDGLRPGDEVGIVAYSSTARVVSASRPVTEAADLHAAIDGLQPGDSTNLEDGLLLGYHVARQGYRRGSTNRVVLLTDGLANTGATDADQILAEVHEQAGNGIALLTVGVGSEYGDALMERLADRGDGITAYVRNTAQAEDVFLHRLPATIELRAVDAKAQVRFEPGTVASYRLLGYDDRAVADDDFRDDTVDGGEVGAGHSVTALYVVRLRSGAEGTVATATVRWHDPAGGGPRETSHSVSVEDISGELGDASPRLRTDVVAALVAERLRGGAGDLRALAEQADRVASELDDPAVDDLAALAHAAARLSSSDGPGRDPVTQMW